VNGNQSYNRARGIDITAVRKESDERTKGGISNEQGAALLEQRPFSFGTRGTGVPPVRVYQTFKLNLIELGIIGTMPMPRDGMLDIILVAGES